MATSARVGLENVVAAESALAAIDGDIGSLRYAGYTMDDLVGSTRFEEIVLLLWNGDLPDRATLEQFQADLRALRELTEDSFALLRALPPSLHPMDALRTAVSALAGDAEAEESLQLPGGRRAALRLIAQMPTLVAAWGRLRQRLPVIPPRPDLGHAANVLWMYHGSEPSAEQVAALDAYLVLLAEHSLNASTFAARVVIGALGDIYGAVTAALATLKGAAHGGANQKAYEMLATMQGPEGVGTYVEESLRIRRRIMGIGHRIYKVEDPRTRHLRAHALRLVASGADPIILRTAEALQALTTQHPYFQERRLAPNVEFFSAPLLGALGFPPDMFPSLFACSRIAGWSAHIFEQLQNNRLIRPKAAYVGPEQRVFVPIEQRSGM